MQPNITPPATTIRHEADHVGDSRKMVMKEKGGLSEGRETERLEGEENGAQVERRGSRTLDHANVQYISDKVKIAYSALARGRGMFATQHIRAGEKLLEERPLLLQREDTPSTLTTTCDLCLRFTGPQLLHWQTIAEGKLEGERLLAALDHLPHKDLFPILPQGVLCACGLTYCSVECRDRAWASHHCVLCPGTDKTHPWHAVAQLACDEFDLLTMAAKAVAVAVQHGRRLGTRSFLIGWESCFGCLAHKNWLDLLFVEQEDGEKVEYLSRAAKETMARDGHRLLMDLLGRVGVEADFDDLHQTLTYDFYLRILGMLESNITEVTVMHPVQTYHDRLRRLSRGGQADREALYATLLALGVAQVLNRETYPYSESSSICPIHASINHSCAPNAAIHCPAYANEWGNVTVLAQDDIPPKSEIFISYLELKELGNAKRRRRLLKETYMFDCLCTRCQADMAAGN